MRLLLYAAAIVLYVLPSSTAAQDAQSYDQARTLSTAQSKPILLEFFRDD